MTLLRIERRIRALGEGLLGDWKGVGAGVCELRLHFGSGYRIYYAHDGDVLLILLCGGDKGTQAADIARAKTYWQDYQERKKDKA